MNMESTEYSYWMALAHMDGMYTANKMDLLIKCFKSQCSLSDFFMSSDDIKTRDFLMNADEIERINLAKKQVPNYAFMVESLLEQGYQLTTIWEEEYPRHLKQTMVKNSPLVLYTKGDRKLLQEDIVAIVGSRKASAISLQFTDNVAKKCVSAKKVVVSGYAKGIDRQALESTLAANGKSIVVLPQGITTFSSGYNHLYKEIIAGDVLVLSYFHPKAGWDVGLAMARNAVVYGLANDIFVAESDDKGGTWSGVISGLKMQQKNSGIISIYVRVPIVTEKNANNELISMGARPVDMEGQIEECNNAIDNMELIQTKILHLLQSRTMSPEEVVNALKLKWDKKRAKAFLDSLSAEGVVKVKKGRCNCYTIKTKSDDLFGGTLF